MIKNKFRTKKTHNITTEREEKKKENLIAILNFQFQRSVAYKF
jgi:hypothetical protein